MEEGHRYPSQGVPSRAEAILLTIEQDTSAELLRTRQVQQITFLEVSSLTLAICQLDQIPLANLKCTILGES